MAKWKILFFIRLVTPVVAVCGIFSMRTTPFNMELNLLSMEQLLLHMQMPRFCWQAFFNDIRSPAFAFIRLTPKAYHCQVEKLAVSQSYSKIHNTNLHACLVCTFLEKCSSKRYMTKYAENFISYVNRKTWQWREVIKGYHCASLNFALYWIGISPDASLSYLDRFRSRILLFPQVSLRVHLR